MKKFLRSIRKFYKKITNNEREFFEENGERIFIDATKIDYNKFDFYQKNHFKRYEFAKTKVTPSDHVGDFACGTGYGTLLLASCVKEAVGVDIDSKIIKAISNKYIDIKNVKFINSNLLNLSFNNEFDKIISFETVEHLEEENIGPLFKVFNSALKPKGLLIFSVPYMQEACENALRLGHHKTFYINEEKIASWLLATKFKLKETYFQNYENHDVVKVLNTKDFILCVAQKI